MKDEISIKIAQLHNVIRWEKECDVIEHVIKNIRDINYKIKATDFLKLNKPELIGCTALHLAASENKLQAFDILLKHGADFTLANDKNMTVVHQIIHEKIFNEAAVSKLIHEFHTHGNGYTRNNAYISGVRGNEFALEDVHAFEVMQRVVERNYDRHDNWRMRGSFKNPFVDSVLSAHMKNDNTVNPRDNNGISHFHAACMTNNSEAVEFFLKNGTNVAETVSTDSPIFAGFTPLHFASWYSCVKTVEILLNYGADVNLKNAAGMTPLHVLVDQSMKIIAWIRCKNTLSFKNCVEDVLNNEKIIGTIMENSVVKGIDNSIYLFATLNKMEKIESFLKNSVIAQDDSPLWPGGTASHVAAFFNIEYVKLLLANGADIEAKDANGMTPLDVLVTKARIKDIHFILSTKESWRNITLSDGKTKLLDFISAMENFARLNSFLKNIEINTFVPHDSPLWPGYTVLHFAVMLSESMKKTTFHDATGGNEDNDDDYDTYKAYKKHFEEQEKIYFEKVMLCLSHKADVAARDARGRTPIHLAYRQRKMEVVKLLLGHHVKNANPIDGDNLSHLHIASAVGNSSVVELLLSNGADIDLQILPTFRWQNDHPHNDVFSMIGSTPLHVAVSNGNLDVVRILIDHNAKVNLKDADGLTAIHRVFLCHVIWDIGNKIFMWPHRGSTFLSVRESIPNYVDTGKNLGSTGSALVSSSNLRESIVDDYQLSHLHVACWVGDAKPVQTLLDLGSDVNATIKYECSDKLRFDHPLHVLSRYQGTIPLNLNFFKGVSQILLERGADILARDAEGWSWMFNHFKSEYIPKFEPITRILEQDEGIRTRWHEESGWTMLHYACFLIDVDIAEESLNNGVDVNSVTRADSPIYPGFTPLHILIRRSNKHDAYEEIEEKFKRILKLLLDNGADLMVADFQGNTALHGKDIYMDGKWDYHEKIRNVRMLFNHIKDYKTNHVNNEGVSVFHSACRWRNVEAIKRFIENGVDVDQPIDYFARAQGGFTPLHLALEQQDDWPKDTTRQLEAIDLLLEGGADVDAEDVKGDTPLHCVSSCHDPREGFYRKILAAGADINAKNVRAQTPFESLLRSRRAIAEDIRFFLKLGCRANSFNSLTQDGYISIMCTHCIKTAEYPAFKALMSCSSVDEPDDLGRTAIHNVVSRRNGQFDEDEYEVMEYLIARGCDIDRQDKFGQTALHYAARRRNNYISVEGLLIYGADVNVLDSSGKTAFVYAMEGDDKLVICSFARYVSYMESCGLYVHEINKQALRRAVIEIGGEDWNKMREEFEALKGRTIESTSLTVGDFMRETGAIVVYPKLPQEVRGAVDKFFTSTVHGREFMNKKFLCAVQYRKALARSELVERARNALNVVLKFPMPELCFDALSRFLGNADLKNLIVAAS